MRYLWLPILFFAIVGSTGSAAERSSPFVSRMNQYFKDVAKQRGFEKAAELMSGKLPIISSEKRSKQGKIVVTFVIHSNGLTGKIKIEETSDEGIAQEYIREIEQWKFSPAEKSGKPVPFAVTLPFTW